ncbi:MAG: class I SAM-dependent methyltransferase [Methanoregula sp.]|jgi:ubiquinone/menaquinone biosynthesis C-methylase UbiE|uniref:class I SAM-dependent methyltransferase n=1 Tax=Methanoregula sp. TaxID=2052170 RepID=UPI0025EBC331|nr:class I SAM-dependent methyltransferase [Methanoregula sp.]MCK9630935.1 class I SAM-dependent methyltransferase [Methanoregula sp.]
MTSEKRNFDSVNAVNGEKRNFDTAAATWDDKTRRLKLANDVSRAICETIGLSPEMDVLDFGCGTGLLTLQIQPLVRSITGIDSSQGMLTVLEEKIRTQGLTNVTVRNIDLEQGMVPEGHYNLVVSSMTLHHIRDVRRVLEILAQVLKPSGALAIADLDSDNGKFHDTPEGVFHNGFDRCTMKKYFEAAGFTQIRNRTAAIVDKESPSGEVRPFTVFLMTGRKKNEE